MTPHMHQIRWTFSSRAPRSAAAGALYHHWPVLSQGEILDAEPVPSTQDIARAGAEEGRGQAMTNDLDNGREAYARARAAQPAEYLSLSTSH